MEEREESLTIKKTFLIVHTQLGTPDPISNSEVKQLTARSVLWCENTREARVTMSYFIPSLFIIEGFIEY
jgi:16S rRNA C1402 (ribose-2'-O) methylase RsmI